MNVELLNKTLVKENLLRYIIHFEELDSTNNYAKENNLPGDGIVITSHQKAGKGRFGRKWLSAYDEDLTFTLTKKFKINIDNLHLVNFYTSYILSETLNSFFSNYPHLRFHLKWPNDILVNQKKVSGILLEIRNLNEEEKIFHIGIGINVNKALIPEDISHKATSIFHETHKSHEIEKILIMFVEKFYECLNLINEDSKLMTLWKNNSDLLGKQVRFLVVADSHEEEAKIINIENDGGLKVLLSDGNIKKFHSGEITFVY